MSNSEHSSQVIPEASADSPSPTELCKLVVDSLKFQEEMAKLANEYERQRLIRVVHTYFECEVDDLTCVFPTPKDVSIGENLLQLSLGTRFPPGFGADNRQQLSRGFAGVAQITDITQKKLDDMLNAVPDAPSEDAILRLASEATEFVRAKNKEGLHDIQELCRSLRGLNWR